MAMIKRSLSRRAGALCPALLLVLAAGACRPSPSRQVRARPAPEEAPRSTSVDDQLALAEKELRAGQHASALRRIGQVLTLDPDHLEATVLRAMVADAASRSGQAGAMATTRAGEDRAEPWKRVEQILVFNGKLRPFSLKSTLYAAAGHYLEQDVEARADLFADEMLRRFPTSEWSARVRLLQAEAAARRGRWATVLLACDRLLRAFASHATAGRCRALAHRARRLRALGPEPDPVEGAWVWEHPLPQGNDLRDVWVGARGEVLVAGEAGTILRQKHGRRFVHMDSGTRWGLNALAGRDGSEVYAVGGGGVVLRFDGKRWETLRAADPTQADLLGAHVTPEGRLVAVGAGGRVVRRELDGSFVVVATGALGLRGVWGPGNGTLFAVGDEGTLLRQVGDGDWQRLKSDSYEDLWSLHGRSPTEMLAVGSRRTVVAFDGQRAKEDVVGTVDLRDVWVGGKQLAWAVGAAGGIVHRRGPRWRRQRSGTLLDLAAVVGRDDGRELWAAGDGGTILHGDGSRWTIVSGGLRQRLVSLSARSRSPVALGEDGLLLVRGRGGRWSTQTLPVVGLYAGMWSDGTRLAAVGHRGLLVVRESGAYRRVVTDTAEDLSGVWGWPGGLVVVGSRGTVLRLLGAAERPIHDQTPVGLDLRAVAGRGSEEGMVAVGARGVVLRFRDGRWTEERSGTLSDLNAVWVGQGQTVAVGVGGTIVRQGRSGRWRTERAPTDQDLVGVWGSEAGVVHVVAAAGTAIRFDGQSWRVQRSPAACLTAVDGDPAIGVLAVGCHGSVLRAEGGAGAGRRGPR